MEHTSHESVPLEILFGSLGKENICFVQKENAPPTVGECEVCFQCEFDVLGRCSKIPCRQRNKLTVPQHSNLYETHHK